MSVHRRALALSALLATLAAAQPSHTLPPDLASPGSPVLIPRAGGTVFTEGVAADWTGNVYYNEMGNNNRTMQVKVGADSAKPWRQAKDAPNGMWLDTQGRLVICQTRAIVRVKPGAAFDNRTDTLYAYPNLTGSNFNDVTGDSRDNLFFTNFEGRTVYFRSEATGQTKVVLSNQPKPNGIEWDEERKRIYLCENEAGKVSTYDVGEDFSLTNRQDFADVPGADGIVLDVQGNVYVVAYGSDVRAFSPSKALLGIINLSGSQITNLAFGGADFKTLFMCTNKGLYKLPMLVKGYKTGAPPTALRHARSRVHFPILPIPAAYRLDGRRREAPRFPKLPPPR